MSCFLGRLSYVSRCRSLLKKRRLSVHVVRCSDVGATAKSSSARKSKNVAIIGAGASGLVCARECLREGHQVCVFEQSNAIGGTWQVDPVPPNLRQTNVLSEEWRDQSSKVFSSMYDNLRTNLPREIMGYSDFPFDDAFAGSMDSRRFCEHQEVRRYLEAFAAHFHLNAVVQLNTSVLRINPTDAQKSEWNVELLYDGDVFMRRFDAVVVANGHYSVPHFPVIKHLEKGEMLCLHSHLYRNENPFVDKTVAILGNANSGLDLAQEISQVAKNVYICGRTWKPDVDLSKSIGFRKNIHQCRTIEQCSGKGQLLLEDGRVLSDVDVLIFCTGYEFSFPFLQESNLVSMDKNLIYPLYQNFLHARHPTLTFPAILYTIVPFLVAEYQSKLIARIYSERCRLPSTNEMLQKIDKSLEDYMEQNGSLEKFLVMSDKQFDYVNDLARLCGDVEPLSEWRRVMYSRVREHKRRFPDDYRDQTSLDDCFAQAELEFNLIRTSTSTLHKNAASTVQTSTVRQKSV